MIFVPDRIYSLDEIERLSNNKPVINQTSYATIAAVISNHKQYDFVFYPFNAQEGWVLIAVSGDPPANST